MTGADWHDPFAEDGEAQERERRRAEREARRRGTQASLGEKVSEGSAQQEEPSAPAESPPTAEEPVAVEPTAAPAEPEPSARADTTRPAEAPPHHPPPTADPGFEWTDSPRSAQPSGGGSGGVSPQLLWFRRALGLLAVLGLVAVVGFVFTKLVDAIGGDDEPATAGQATLQVGNVLIPEGLTRRQIADEVKKQVRGDYMDATKEPPRGFDLAKYAPDGAPSLEGFLFPDTYELEKNARAEDLVALQLENFERRVKGVDMSYAESKNLNVYDVLKIASIIEREIAVPEEREIAAAVVYNRLAAGDTLGMDSTIRYYLQNYDEQLTTSELEDPHPFNTRVNPGLPPTPIGNPGLASIEAAANPAKSKAYYFVIKPGTCNEHVFAETEDEFLQAEAEYQAALQEEGGSPTDC